MSMYCGIGIIVVTQLTCLCLLLGRIKFVVVPLCVPQKHSDAVAACNPQPLFHAIQYIHVV